MYYADKHTQYTVIERPEHAAPEDRRERRGDAARLAAAMTAQLRELRARHQLRVVVERRAEQTALDENRDEPKPVPS